jgi:DNA-binding LacI/PurR family transcriptional regulator
MFKIDKRNPQPLYRQIKEDLRQRIYDGKLKPGSAIQDERTLAAELGLSRMTVRRALVELTREGLFERIPGRGTFVKETLPGKSIDSTASIGTVGIVAHFDAIEVRNSLFYFRILQGLTQNAHPGDSFAFRKISTDLDAYIRMLESDTSLDAIVILGVIDPIILNALSRLELPAVLVDSAQPSLKQLDYVSHHSEESCFQAVSHLLQLGHRDIAIVNFQDTPASRERHRGYERALASRGVTPVPEFQYCVECNSAGGYTAGRLILNGPRIPTAIFCTADEIAVGLITAAKDEGWKVPQKLSVIGFGDVGQFCAPALSTVRVPTEQLGVEAAKYLRERKLQPILPPRHFILPTEFIVRATSDVPRA